ncbi:tetratricopeptide repeat protein [Niallia endozanthoxylica]|uniref:Tetratricopeptide repeat protein n=1 Tax=Niallia endozanthoxylica TaxID=2036016 RepID=A0A5J5HWU8_9BACI|nr:tetratricopeptide repeat protein [Niallia endozanthoxylica]KAA9026118.1 tetratricopeptide repeat protein [Niallia endozanthoxylica]
MESVNKIISQLENGQHEEALKGYERILKHGSNEERFLLGEELVQYGFLEEAKSLFQHLLEYYPEEGEILVLLAETLIELGKEEEAILELEKINENDPSFPESLVLLADLYQLEGLYEVSEQKLLKAKALLPDEVVIDFALGELYTEEGKFVQAIKCYERVLETEHEIGGVNVNQRMADAISAGGAFEDALPYYEKALENKLEINTLFNYGFTALQAGYNGKAIEKFLELKELDPEYYSLYSNLARAYEREEDSEKGYQILKEGIQYDEFNKDLYNYAGKLALKTGKEEEAEHMFREALALDPELTEAALTLNKLLLHQERWEDVLEIVHMMEEGDEIEPRFFWDAALAHQNLEKYSQALNSYENAYNFYKDTIDFLVDYGYFLIEEGERERAVEIFNKLVKSDPSNEEYQDVWQRLTDDVG